MKDFFFHAASRWLQASLTGTSANVLNGVTATGAMPDLKMIEFAEGQVLKPTQGCPSCRLVCAKGDPDVKRSTEILATIPQSETHETHRMRLSEEQACWDTQRRIQRISLLADFKKIIDDYGSLFLFYEGQD